MCTAFLIAPDLVMTNSHCIPEDLKRPGSDCMDRIRILFPAGSSGVGESLACSHVLKASNLEITENRANEDFAFLELARASSRSPLEVSTEGVTDHLSLLNVRMDPTSDTEPEGVITQDHCTAIQKTQVVPTFDDPIGPLITFGDCETRHGNSGSPLIGPDGKVHAILQARFKPGALFQQLGEDPASPLMIGTNLSCVDRPDSSFRPDDVKCSRFPKKGEETNDLNSAFAALAPELDTRLAGKLSQWSDPAASILKWHPSFQEEQNYLGGKDEYYSPEPTCFNAPNTWIKRYRRFLIYSKRADVDLSLPTWKLKVALNRYYQPTATLEPGPNRLLTLRFNPSELHKNKRSTTTLLKHDAFSLQLSPVYSGTVPTCTK
jgi:hypothetical protein